MSILDDLTEKFIVEMDAMMTKDAQYRIASAQLNEFCETKLTPEQADELNDLVGKLSSAVFHAAARSGMKLGASITAGLLTETS